MQFAPIKQAIKDFKKGKLLIVVDDEDRENEGDLIVAAEKVTRDQIAFMVRHTSGVLCVPITGERLDALHIPMMHYALDPHFQTPFTLSVDARSSTTGISATDRLKTIKTLIDPKTKSDDLFSPGHMFPLRANSDGVFGRAGHTEAAVDFARLAGLYSAGVLGELILDSGEMARLPQLVAFGRRHDIQLITIAQLINYRKKQTGDTVKKTPSNGIMMTAQAKLPTKYGEFSIQTVKDAHSVGTHIVLTFGEVNAQKPILARLHSACTTSEIFGSLRCDCQTQLDAAMEAIAQKRSGILIYLYQEGRGIGLTNKIKAYALQDKGMDTVEANLRLGFGKDTRDYRIAANILHTLGIRNINLLTNNLEKISQLEKYGITIAQRVPLLGKKNMHNERYLKVKREKLGHLL